MLEDELREAFGARVQTPPAALDPAGVAIKRGRRRARRKKLTVGAAATVAFAAFLGGGAALKAMWAPTTSIGTGLSYEGLFGRDLDLPNRSNGSLPILAAPIDVRVGTALWTSDGRRLTFSGVEQVLEVIRVPAGWLYSDDFRLRLLTFSGSSMPVRENFSAWAVSPDGKEVASVAEGTILQVRQPGSDEYVEAVVPFGVSPVTFDGQRVVLQSATGAYDQWTVGAKSYKETWNTRLIAVYTSAAEGPIGIVREEGIACLVDMTATEQGWEIGARLGCGEVVDIAARASSGRSKPARSPDGHWLAVPSSTGVHLIDLKASRAAAVVDKAAQVITGKVCQSVPDAPAVWVDAKTVLTISENAGIAACGTDGSRYAVPLPSGVTDGWALVPRVGLVG